MNYTSKKIKQKIDAIRGERVRNQKRIFVFAVGTGVTAFIAAVFIFAFLCLGSFIEIISNTPSINNISDIQPSENKSIIYASDGSVMQELVQSGSNRISVSYEEMPQNLIYAFVAIEDARFFQHNGVDVKGVIRAIVSVFTKFSLSEGASTLTQQLIKNNIFNGGMETNLGERLERKFQEQYLALRVEKSLSKETILEYYLNTINLGSNCLGVQVAANRYFNKDVSELDLAECSVLAAITQNPSKFNPIKHPDKNQERRATVLKYMYQDGYITESAYKEALSEDVYKRIQTVAENYDSSRVFSYFTDAVFEDVLDALVTDLGYTESEAYNLLYAGGLRIYSTMDPEMQAIAEDEINNEANYYATDGSGNQYIEYSMTYRLGIKLSDGETYYFDENNVKSYFKDTLGQTVFTLTFNSKEELEAAAAQYKDYILSTVGGTVISESVTATLQPQASVVIMDQSTGEVKALVGGRGNKKEMGSLVLNRATETTRQPGSSFKIISTYAPAIDKKGATLATTLYDSPLYVDGRLISNWWGTMYMGYSNLREAVMASMNIVAVRTLENIVTLNLGYDYVQDFGISTLVSADKNVLFSLGGLTYGVKNIELTAAYATIANGGAYQEPILWTKITDADGNVLLEKTQQKRTIIKETTAQLLTSAMESSVNISDYFVPFPSYNVNATSQECQVPNISTAGKSGTTTDANDVWFVGYSPYLTCGIWSGYDSNKSFGTSPGYHKNIWQHIMNRCMEGYEPAEFDYSGLTKCLICSKSGLLAKEGVCDSCNDPECHVYEEYFVPGTEPTEYCTRHVVYTICKDTGLLATDDCPEENTEKIIYFVIDPADNDGYETDDTPNVLPAELINSYCTKHVKEDSTDETQKDPFAEESSTEESDTEESSSEKKN